MNKRIVGFSSLFVGIVSMVYFFMQTGIIDLYGETYINFFMIILALLYIISIMITFKQMKKKLTSFYGLIFFTSLINLLTIVVFGMVTIFSVLLLVSGIGVLVRRE